MAQQHEDSKFLYTTLLKRKRSLSSYIPETHIYTLENVRMMLDKYITVFLKEDRGLGGQGIIRLSKLDNGTLEAVNARADKKIIKLEDLPLWTSIRYIVQQGIEVDRHNEGSYDIRVYMQRLKDEWVHIGTVARVADKDRYVTHLHRKGTAERIENILSPEKINKIAMNFADEMLTYFPGLREIGFDFVRDVKGKYWFLEANTIPAYGAFKNTYPEVFKVISDGKKKLQEYPESTLRFINL